MASCCVFLEICWSEVGFIWDFLLDAWIFILFWWISLLDLWCILIDDAICVLDCYFWDCCSWSNFTWFDAKTMLQLLKLYAHAQQKPMWFVLNAIVWSPWMPDCLLVGVWLIVLKCPAMVYDKAWRCMISTDCCCINLTAAFYILKPVQEVHESLCLVVTKWCCLNSIALLLCGSFWSVF